MFWKSALQPVSISGVVETEEGELWLNTFAGIVRVSKAELARRMADSTYALSAQRYDTQDGLPGLANDRWPDPSIVESASGRLWFATSRGVAWLDPQLSQKAKNTLPPTVVVESLKSQGSMFQGHDDIRLPPHPQGIEIAYTALSLTIPERVRFRYKLEGIDKDWQDPGSRRLALYTHLPAGGYHFRVIASNNDGVWNEQGAELQFSIAPAFYETWSFKVAMGVMVVLAVLWGVRSRIGHIRRQLEVLHAERLSERERIARELHDTLLQDFQAAILQFHLVGSCLRDEEAHAALNRGLDYADHALLEGRDRIRDIRHDTDTANELSEMLAKYGEETAKLWPATFAMSLIGKPYEINARTRDEIYQIGHEAICNAFKHSGGYNVRAEISYGRNTFRMRISDDGVGMEPDLFENGRAGHWGMLHMHERAQNIGATLEVRSEKDKGTTLELRLERANTRHIGRAWFMRILRGGTTASA